MTTKGVEDGMGDEQVKRSAVSSVPCKRHGSRIGERCNVRIVACPGRIKDARSKLPKPPEDSIRSATPKELTAEAESYGKNYKPGPRQATPFMPEATTETAEEAWNRGYEAGCKDAIFDETGCQLDYVDVPPYTPPSAPLESPTPPVPERTAARAEDENGNALDNERTEAYKRGWSDGRKWALDNYTSAKPIPEERTAEIEELMASLRAAANAGKRAETDYGQSFIRRNADIAMFEQAASPENILKLLDHIEGKG